MNHRLLELTGRDAILVLVEDNFPLVLNEQTLCERAVEGVECWRRVVVVVAFQDRLDSFRDLWTIVYGSSSDVLR